MSVQRGTRPVISSSFLLVLLGVTALALALPVASVHAQTAASTQWDSIIEYSTSSGYTPTNVDITWKNTNSCGSFGGTGPGATWNYGSGVGANPCTSSLPGGTITETISQDGVVLATCRDTNGASTWGSTTPNAGASAPGCTTGGTGVVVAAFWAQAYDASGNPIAASSGANYDWIIALVVIIIILLLLFFVWRRRKKSPTAAAQVPAATSGTHPSSSPQVAGTTYCGQCGQALDPGAGFCKSCGAKVS